MPTQHSHDPHGFTLLEVIIATTILAMIAAFFVPLFISPTQAFSSLATRAHITAHGQAIMDRLWKELAIARLSSLDPPVPTGSNYLRFDRPVGFVAGETVYGNPLQVDLVPLNPSEDGIRIWEDRSPLGTTPGAEDSERILCGNVAPGGLAFTRLGATITVEVTFQADVEPGKPPQESTVISSVKLRNTN